MRSIGGAILALALSTLPAPAEVFTFAARTTPASGELVIYSTLDQRLALPLIDAFQSGNPGIAVRYEDLLADEIARRVVSETDAGRETADFIFSSAMDVQIKLANDGYAQPVAVAAARGWPVWANWRDTAFALTFEPGVLVYHKPFFPDDPGTRHYARQDRHL
jgi:iron(III) transport system substrate-binding protein